MIEPAWRGAPILVAGIGADGWGGLGPGVRAELAACTVLFGSARQLELVPAGEVPARRVAWPSPLLPALPGLLAAHAAARIGVLASGDPMFFGIGSTLAGLFGPEALLVRPQPSSVALACARLGWAAQEIPVVSAVGRPVQTVLPELTDGRRILVLSADGGTPESLAKLLRENGFGGSTLTVLEQLGGPAEARRTGTAAGWPHPACDPLNIVAVEAVADAGHLRLTRTPGLPDAVFGGDGQFTKAEIRALTLAALAPAPGELLWDVGGGSGTIAIEWCRAHPSCRAVTFEQRADRRAQIAANAGALGVPGIAVRGAAPDFQPADGTPDAVFVGGGITQPGLLEACWAALPPGGRLVAAAVTAESESLLLANSRRYGGTLRRYQVYRGTPLGGFTTWSPQLPVTHWAVRKSRESPAGS
ncbi:precorrin-6y C5,15-methyltransferase (decarboxylating) subunit CbiE [Nocardia harenae]|uniref:precorrin-6y C5,15-methyltransferase (decarboxylating) subunit CbiE n=1 Tax=Nocardia harenae TaxID=358707 RepID=UPI00157CB6F1|nr:precorrin-6y C5,15-methyltransferase (decarboxylating) subunit CbiE [Nocardia harenae]